MNIVRELSRIGINIYKLRNLDREGITEAPKDGKEYVRKNGVWVEKTNTGGESGGLTQPQIMARNLGC